MAILFTDGFEERNSAKWDTFSLVANSTTPRTGARSLAFVAASSIATKIVGSKGTLVVGFGLRKGSTDSGSNTFVTFIDSATSQVGLRINNDGSIAVYRGGSTASTQLGSTSAAGVIPTNAYVYVEFKVVFHASAGSFEVWVDGASIISASGLDTTNTANDSADRVRFGNTAVSQDIDDLYIDDATEHGICKVEHQKPNAAGTFAEFTPSAGSNWQNVDEQAHDSDTTYNSTTTTGHRDSFNHTDLVTATGDVIAIQHIYVARKDDVGVREIAELHVQGGSEYAGDTKTLTTSYQTFLKVRETNPHTGNVYTIAELNSGVETGYKEIT